jgi:hypothetical protein
MKYLSLCVVAVVLGSTGCYQETEEPSLYALQNCADETVSPYEWEGTVDVVRLFFVAGWCAACSQQVLDVYKKDQLDPTSRLMIILGQDNYEGAATMDYCKEYADSHGLPQDQIYLDPNWETTWEFLGIEAPGPTYLPFKVLLDGDNMDWKYYNMLP